MDIERIGGLIRSLRREKGLTQRELAQAVGVGDKAVSKWETGSGCPDVSLLPALSDTLGVDMASLLSGGLTKNDERSGNMKKLRFYVCPDCGNIVTSTGEAAVYCCGRPLAALTANKPDEAHDLTVESVEDEWFVSSAHPMEREHFISFAALVLSDRVEIVRCYPEWDLQARFFKRGHGMLCWYCTEHGLFRKLI